MNPNINIVNQLNQQNIQPVTPFEGRTSDYDSARIEIEEVKRQIQEVEVLKGRYNHQIQNFSVNSGLTQGKSRGNKQ